MKNLHIVFYTSSHGFGHSTRMTEVANHIHLPHRITFTTMSPQWIYNINARRPFEFRKQKIDGGVKQSDCITILEKETLEEYGAIINRKEGILKEETKWLKENSVDIIISDIAPIAFTLGKKLSIPSIGISNFSWDWIYRPMIKKYKEYSHVIDDICNDYKEADLFLRLPLHGDVSIFSNIKDIPFIARSSYCETEKTKEKLGINRKEKLILLSLSGYDMAKINFLKLEKELSDFRIISFNPEFPEYKNFIRVKNEKHILHEDVVRASDIVVSKPGYGIVSECIANRTKFLYTTRKDYIETHVLEEGLKKFAISEEMSNEDFLGGKWHDHINKLLSKENNWPTVNCNGAETAVDEIFKFL